MMRKRHALLAALLGVVSAVALAPLPASATSYPVAYLQRTQFLLEFPGNNPAAVQNREIYLTTGCYYRKMFDYPAGSSPSYGDEYTQIIYLVADTYAWGTVLAPANSGSYVRSDTLDSVDQNLAASQIWFTPDIYASGNWTWGTSLEWLTPGPRC